MCRLKMNGLLLAAGLVLAVWMSPLHAEPKGAGGSFIAPWKTPQEAPRYIMIRGKGDHPYRLVNAVTGETVPGGQFDGGRLDKRSYPIDGRPGVFLGMAYTDHSGAQNPLEAFHLASHDGLISERPRAHVYLIDLNASGEAQIIRPHFAAQADGGGQKDGPNAPHDLRYSDDMRRVVWIQSGDVWRGDIDWTTGEIMRPKQVTHVGQFEFVDRHLGLRDGKARPMFWSGNNLFIESGFNHDKPLVRINLTTGELSELDWLMFEGKSIARDVAFDPLERIALHGLPDQLRLIDLTSGKVFTVNMGFPDSDTNQHLPSPNPGYVHSDPWISDSVILTFKGLLNVTDGSINCFGKSPADGEADAAAVAGNARPWTYYLRFLNQNIGQALRNGDPIAIELPTDVGEKPGDPATNTIVDLHRGAVLGTLTSDLGPFSWLNGYVGMYVVTGKGLSDNGTYLYDRRTDSAIRLTAYTDLSDPIAIADGSTIVFSRGGDLYRIGTDGSDLKKLADDASVQTMFMSRTISFAGGDPWAIEPPGQLAVFTSGSEGELSPRDRVKRAVRDKPAEVQAIALKALEQVGTNFMFVKYFDPVKATLAIVGTWEKGGVKDLPNAIFKTDFTGTLDPARARASFRERIAKLYAYNDVKPTDEQLDAFAHRCTERLLAAQLPPGQIMHLIDTIFDEEGKTISTAMYKQAHAVSSKPVQQTKPVQQAEPAQPAQPDEGADAKEEQEAEESGNVVDDTIDKAKDAKKAIKSLRGLFGH